MVHVARSCDSPNPQAGAAARAMQAALRANNACGRGVSGETQMDLSLRQGYQREPTSRCGRRANR